MLLVVLHLFRENKPMEFLKKEVLEPEITATGNCHSCCELVQWGTPKCPYCGTLLDKRRMYDSAVENFYITQAVSSANTIRTFRPAAFLFIVALGLSLMGSGSPAIKFIWPLALIVIIRWFIKHGRINSTDADYLEAKQKMRVDFFLWLAINILNLIVFIVLIKRTK
ncbi:MAG: hypothetical protein ACKVZH_12895 [Blastocatellia bacterium]